MMRNSHSNTDRILLGLLLLILVGVPAAIYVINDRVRNERIPPGARVFHLTGHTEKGWILGEVQAYEVATLNNRSAKPEIPELHVKKGDRVVIKLSSSDVIHGFSLKDFGIFIMDGILPGKITTISFVAHKPGTFTFSCNSICGDVHEQMKGVVVVSA